jgi:CheY-like chemotaxis protein
MHSPKTIFIIESDHQTRVALRQALEARGHFVVSAADGAQALRLLEQMSAPELILLDMDMPIMTGEQFLGLFEADPRFSKIPVLQLVRPLDTLALIKMIEGS